MSDTIRGLHKRLAVPVELFEAFMEKRGWSWHQLARAELPMTFEEIQYGLICSDRVLWATAHLVEPDTGQPYRFWEYQHEPVRFNGNRVHQDGAEVGKTREIIVRLLYCAFTRPRSESMEGAPEQVHLDDAIDGILHQFDVNKSLGKCLVRHKKHPHHVMYFTNGSKIYFSPAGFDGTGFRGKHVNGECIFEEAAKAKNPDIWVEFWRAGKPGCQFGIYSVPDGDRTSPYYKLTQLAKSDSESNRRSSVQFADKTDRESPSTGMQFRLFHIPKTVQPEPFWSQERRRGYIDIYGGEDSPGYLRNCLGLHGDPENVVFPFAQFMRCVKEIPEYRCIKVLMNDSTASVYVARYELRGIPASEGREEAGKKATPHPVVLEDVEVPLSSFAIAAVIKQHLAAIPGVLALGADLGFAKDPTEITVRLLLGDSSRTVARIQLKGVSYDLQEEVLNALDDIFRFHRLGLDIGSAGQAVAHALLSPSNAERNYAERLVLVNFGGSMEYVDETGELVIDPKTEKPARAQAKELSTDLLVKKMQRQKWDVPPDPDYLKDFPSHTWRQGTRNRIFRKDQDHLIDAERALECALAAAIDVEQDYFAVGVNQR